MAIDTVNALVAIHNISIVKVKEKRGKRVWRKKAERKLKGRKAKPMNVKGQKTDGQAEFFAEKKTRVR